MPIRVAINGFGRIGRCVYRAALGRPELHIVAVNDLADVGTLAALLRRDSVHGAIRVPVAPGEGELRIAAQRVQVCSEADPAKLPWRDLGVDVVVEATGRFRKPEGMEAHRTAGARRVVLTAPARGEIDRTVVMGVNDSTLDESSALISAASCTTNCLAPLAQVVHSTFGIRRGLMTTVHAYTNDQRILDLPHRDLRRARAAAVNLIPTSTGAAVAVGQVLPELAGRLDGMAVRAPVPCGSMVDLVADLERPASAEAVNEAVQAAAQGRLRGILQYSEEPLVSSDVVDNPHSCIFDSLLTRSMGATLIKVIGWYDNEWGYSNRVVDLLLRLASLEEKS